MYSIFHPWIDEKCVPLGMRTILSKIIDQDQRSKINNSEDQDQDQIIMITNEKIKIIAKRSRSYVAKIKIQIN